jgi:hypothetical protein
VAFAKSQKRADLYIMSQIARHKELHPGANGKARFFHLADLQKLAVVADHLSRDAKMAGVEFEFVNLALERFR